MVVENARQGCGAALIFGLGEKGDIGDIMPEFTVFMEALFEGNEVFSGAMKGDEAHQYREKQGFSHRSVAS